MDYLVASSGTTFLMAIACCSSSCSTLPATCSITSIPVSHPGIQTSCECSPDSTFMTLFPTSSATSVSCGMKSFETCRIGGLMTPRYSSSSSSTSFIVLFMGAITSPPLPQHLATTTLFRIHRHIRYATSSPISQTQRLAFTGRYLGRLPSLPLPHSLLYLLLAPRLLSLVYPPILRRIDAFQTNIRRSRHLVIQPINRDAFSSIRRLFLRPLKANPLRQT